MDDDMLLAGVVANCTTAAALLVKFPSGTRGPQGNAAGPEDLE